ncbi:hypothetical protein [Caminicella sporogenes]|nr:hypothetical protein [Caminicella sporogenes]WIF94083.1 hypothetical protein QNI18_07110 [Caminicella sporogenes]
MKINDNSSLINLSYVYCTITVNTIAAIIIFYLKLDIVINNALKRFIGQEFVHKTMVIFYAMILFIYLFFPRFNFILKHIATILTILLSLNFLSIKYLNEE